MLKIALEHVGDRDLPSVRMIGKASSLYDFKVVKHCIPEAFKCQPLFVRGGPAAMPSDSLRKGFNRRSV